MLKGGADLRVIQALLGHEDIGTTEIYTHLETSDLRRAILEHHPRNHSEGTFERLRYPFGGDRPSQTPHQTLSPGRVTAAG